MLVGEVTLLSDPAPSFGGLRVDVRAGGRRLEARADGAVRTGAAPTGWPARWCALRGEVAPVEPRRPWLARPPRERPAHGLAVDELAAGHPSARLANGLRRTLVARAPRRSTRGSARCSPASSSATTETQPADLADDFRGAGLTHLLAVSGQNVAFALALAGPAAPAPAAVAAARRHRSR